MLSDVVFDPTDPQVMVAADRLSGVYRSTDGGATWQLANTGLRTRDVNKLAFSSDGAHLYAATEGEGVFRLDLNGQPPQPAPGVTTPEAQLTPEPRPTLVLTATPTQEPGPTSVAAVLTTTLIPTETALPTATPVPAPEPSTGGGICGGAVAVPLALVGLILLQRREK
jgi:hypothetical protein